MRRISAVMVAVMVAVLVIGVIGAADYQSCRLFGKESEFRVVDIKGNRVKLVPCDSFQSEYQWYFGDGSQYSTIFDDVIVHQYERSGIYPITLRTEGMFGEESITTHRVPVGVPARTGVRISVKAELDELPPEVLVFGTIPLLFLLLSSGS